MMEEWEIEIRNEGILECWNGGKMEDRIQTAGDGSKRIHGTRRKGHGKKELVISEQRKKADRRKNFRRSAGGGLSSGGHLQECWNDGEAREVGAKKHKPGIQEASCLE